MADTTGIDSTALRQSANNIGGIWSDDVMKVFNDLGATQPNPGSFPTAQWLGKIVLDRVVAMQQQALQLRQAYSDICTGLNKIADAMESQDGESADQLNQAIGNLEQQIAADLPAAPSGQ